MCIRCEMLKKNFADHFKNGIKDYVVINMLEEVQFKIIDSFKKDYRENKPPKIGGEFVSIFNDVDTLKGKKDIVFDVNFFILCENENISTMINLKEADIFDLGTISDNVLDRMLELKRKS